MSLIALICLGVFGMASLLAAVWVAAYRLGFNEGRLTVPLRMISALVEHRVACLEEDPARIARDLEEHLGLTETEIERLIERAEQTRRPRSSGLRSA